MLHGPPGNGKTSFCQALAGTLKLDICMLTLASSVSAPNLMILYLVVVLLILNADNILSECCCYAV